MHTCLFESKEAAEEAAFMLRGQWDGCNAILLQELDIKALYTVVQLIGASCCAAGTICYTQFTAEQVLQLYAKGWRNFEGYQLSYINLSGADLNGINFKNASLSQSNLSGCNLCGANFEGASCCAANLSRANLTGANLSSAILLEAKLRYSLLKNTNLTAANLEGADASYCVINKADFTNACLEDAIFYQVLGVDDSNFKSTLKNMKISSKGKIIPRLKFIDSLLLKLSNQSFCFKFIQITEKYFPSAWKICLLCSALYLATSMLYYDLITILTLLLKSTGFSLGCTTASILILKKLLNRSFKLKNNWLNITVLNIFSCTFSLSILELLPINESNNSLFLLYIKALYLTIVFFSNLIVLVICASLDTLKLEE